MGTKDPRFDAYIEKSADFARPILRRLRTLIHKACPDVQETIKWGHPSFEHHGILCGVAAFKRHCGLGFWKEMLLRDQASDTEAARTLDAVGRVHSADELPPDTTIVRLVRQAAALNEAGVKIPRVARKRKPLPMPKDFAAALKRNKAAAGHFEGFPPSHKRDYIEWITEAKTDETRQRRMSTAVEWIAEGKSRNWKYERK